MNRELVNSNLLRVLMMSIMLFTVGSLFANNNDNINRTISREQAIDDLNVYFQIIDRQHGNPYQFISRTDFQSALTQKISILPENLSYKDFDVLLSELNAQLRCGHTTVNLETSLIKEASAFNQFFPYPVKLIDGNLHIDFDQGEIQHGSKLLAINGIASEQILNDLKPLAVTDGFSETKIIREIENRFGYYFFLKYGAFKDFRTTYQDINSKTFVASIAGVTGNEMLVNNYYRPVYLSHERYHKFTHLDAVDSLQTLILTLNTFQANPDWFFERISSRYDEESKEFDFDNLIVDLRNNEGGDRRLLTILYQFLTGDRLFDPSNTSVKDTKIQFTDYLTAINGQFKSEEVIHNAEEYLGKYFNQATEKGYQSEEMNWYETFDAGISWEGEAFDGKIYVLTSGSTFSAAADLARILGDLDNVVLVGEETGGAHVGRTANMLLNYALPNTATQIQVPVIYEEFVNTQVSNLGRGTFPDYLVQPTLESLVSKSDNVLNFTFDLIQAQPTYGSN